MSRKIAKTFISLLATILFGVAICFSQITFEVPKGKIVNDFTFTDDGILKYKGKDFSPSVNTNLLGDMTQKFEIAFLPDKGLAGAIAINYEMNQFLLLNTKNFVSELVEEIPASANKIFWSPSRKYLVVHSSYEGEWFHSINVSTKAIIRDKNWFPKNKMWYLDNTPKWLGKSDILVFEVAVECDPYDNPIPCNNETAYYEVQMNVATLKISKRKIHK
jgi:hypothetical protein